MQITPIRLIKRDAAKLLGLSIDGLDKLTKKDPSFPKPYKMGTTKQAHAYFDYADLVAWHNAKKADAAQTEGV
ncbi:helix-turn-helix transcriptional regulator [Acinetobacter baumannii]